MVHHLVIRHLRYIAHSPRHITKESNEALCNRLGRPLPLEALRSLWENKQRAWMDRHSRLHPEDVVQQVPQFPDLMPALTMQMHAGPTMTTSASSHMWHCRTCGRGFHSTHALKTHCAKAHPATIADPKAGYTYKPTRDSVPGSWQCAHCGEQFHRSANLEYHISRGACQYFDPHRQEPHRPHIGRPHLREAIQNAGLEALCMDSELAAELTNQCALCGRPIPHEPAHPTMPFSRVPRLPATVEPCAEAVSRLLQTY